MHPTGSVSILTVTLLAAVGGVIALALSVTGAEQDAGESSVRSADLESRLGMQAERDHGVGSPRSLHARPAPRVEHPERRPSTAPDRPGLRPDVEFPRDAHPLVRVRPGARIPIRDRPRGDVVEVTGHRTEFGSPTVLGVVRAAGSWLGVSTPTLPNHRLGWVRFDPQRIKADWTRRSIHVRLSERRATLREGGRDLHSFKVTVGAAPSTTPTGRFAVTDTFRGGLNPVYGCCAVALSAVQPNLPSGWPGGDRIAIHGNGTGRPLGQADSNGCLRADDNDVSLLVNHVELGTPVFISR